MSFATTTNVGALDTLLANVRLSNGIALAAETPHGIVDVVATGAALSLPAPRDVDDLLQNERASDLANILAALAHDPSPAVTLNAEDLTFAPLVTRPEKSLCVGFNYGEHAEETGTPIPKAPPLFSKFANALNHHGGVVNLPTNVARQFDYETELVIVFGRSAGTSRKRTRSTWLQAMQSATTSAPASFRRTARNSRQARRPTVSRRSGLGWRPPRRCRTRTICG